MKKFFKIVKWFLIIIFIFIVFVSSYVFIEGRQIYLDAIEKTSLSDKVNNIKNSENYLTLDKIPDDFEHAIIAIEDHRFLKHHGIDIIATCRAIVNNIISFSIVEGGSTITQQLAKNLYFTQEQKFTRKVAELLVAFDLEKNYSKNDILELYINTIYFGDGYYGIKEASNGYFGKEPDELTLDEITLLAGIPNAPSVYSLSNSEELARQRQKRVIDAMIKYEYLDSEAANALP